MQERIINERKRRRTEDKRRMTDGGVEGKNERESWRGERGIQKRGIRVQRGKELDAEKETLGIVG